MLLHRGWYSILCRHDVLQQDCSKTRALEVGDCRRLVLPQNLHWNGVVLGEVDPSLDLVAPQVLHLPLLGRVHLSRPPILPPAAPPMLKLPFPPLKLPTAPLPLLAPPSP